MNAQPKSIYPVRQDAGLVSNGRWLASLFILGFVLSTAFTASAEKSADPVKPVQQISGLRGQYSKDAHQVNLEWQLPAGTDLNSIRVNYSYDGKHFKTAGLVWVLNHENDTYRFKQPVSGKKSAVVFQLVDDQGLTETISINTK